MPIDVAARVTDNRALSADYNVLSLAAPDIAAAAQPGQFVMLKTSPGVDPLLRRPFSIFEVLRDGSGQVTGLSVFSKRAGHATARLYECGAGQIVPCLGPLGMPWRLVTPPAEAWLVAGGVGLAAFATLADALRRARVRTTLFYGARTGGELFCLDLFRGLGVELVLATEDGSIGERGRVVAPLERRVAERRGADLTVYACGPEPMMRAAAAVAARGGVPCQVSMERIMGCGLGGCYSCVVAVKTPEGRPHHVRSCLSGPVMNAESIVW